MDKKIANNIIVGIVVTVGFVGFLFVLFNIGGGTGLFSSQYSLFARFSHVKGLHYGSEVSLAGLRIGVVKSITISSESAKELVVELAIQKSIQDKIRADSVASIKTQGVLGDKYIEISIGSPDEPIVKAGAYLRVEETADLFTKSGDLVEEVKRHFSKNGDFDSLLRNLNLLSANLAALTTDARNNKGLLHEIVYGPSGSRLASATAHLSEILRKVNEGEGTLGALVNDPTVYEDIKAMMGGAKRSNILKYFMRSFIESGDKADTKK